VTNAYPTRPGKDESPKKKASILQELILDTRYTGGIQLRKYQVDVVKTVIDSVANQRGFSVVVQFPEAKREKRAASADRGIPAALILAARCGNGQDLAYLEATNFKRYAAFATCVGKKSTDAGPVGKGKRLYLPTRTRHGSSSCQDPHIQT
jgi:hypothetical protein